MPPPGAVQSERVPSVPVPSGPMSPVPATTGPVIPPGVRQPDLSSPAVGPGPVDLCSSQRCRRRTCARIPPRLRPPVCRPIVPECRTLIPAAVGMSRICRLRAEHTRRHTRRGIPSQDLAARHKALCGKPVRRCRPMGHRGRPVRLDPFCRRSPGPTRRNRCPTSRPPGRHPGFRATSACREPRRRAQSSSAPGRRALRRPVACRRVIPTNQELDSQASWNQVLAQWARDRRVGHGGRRPVSISQHSIRREVPGDWNLSLPGGLAPRRRQDRLRWCRPRLRCPHR